MAKKIRVKPGKFPSAIAFIVALLFVVIGIFVVIPLKGPSGILWTLLAAGIAIAHGKNLFSKDGIATEVIEGAEEEVADADVDARMKRLQNLYDQGLVTAEEYEKKREEILRQL